MSGMWGLESGGVTAGDGIICGVVVAVLLLGGCWVEDGVGGGESSDGRVVPAGAEVGEAGAGVLGLVEEAVVIWPQGRRGAAGVAVGGLLPPGRGGEGGVEAEGGGVVLVAEFEAVGVAGSGADGFTTAGQVVEAGAGDRPGGGVECDFFVRQVQGGLAGVFLQ